jgi:integrase/recombinase XerD
MVGTLKGRAKEARVVGFHAHRLRHTAAVRWLRAGGSEVGLMAQAGWTSNSMIGRYTKTASEQLAAEEFDRLNLGIEL